MELIYKNSVVFALRPARDVRMDLSALITLRTGRSRRATRDKLEGKTTGEVLDGFFNNTFDVKAPRKSCRLQAANAGNELAEIERRT